MQWRRNGLQHSFMKQILSFFSVMLLGFGVVGALHAQTDTNAPSATEPKPTPEAIVDHRLKDLTQKLTLTDAQQAQLKPILLEEVQKIVALHENASLADADKRSQAQALHDEYKSKIEAVLTPDQKTIFESLKEGHHWFSNGGQAGASPSGN